MHDASTGGNLREFESLCEPGPHKYFRILPNSLQYFRYVLWAQSEHFSVFLVWNNAHKMLRDVVPVF